MGMGTAGMTHLNRSGVDEGNARNLPPAGLQKAAQQHQTPGHQLHKAAILIMRRVLMQRSCFEQFNWLEPSFHRSAIQS